MSGSEWEAYYGRYEAGARCDIEAYRAFRDSCHTRSAATWNTWRAGKPEVFLQGLEISDTRIPGLDLENVHLEGAKLLRCVLEPDVTLEHAHLTGAYFEQCTLAGVRLYDARAEGVDFTECCLADAVLARGRLDDSIFLMTDLARADLSGAHLRAAQFDKSDLRGTSLNYALVDGAAMFLHCDWDDETRVEGAHIETARIDSHVLQGMDYIVRRKRWEQWYRRHPRAAPAVRVFWFLSDYGHSFPRLAKSFVYLVLVFAFVYSVSEYLAPGDGLISGLGGNSQDGRISPYLIPVRAVYFSIVTVTTLGFGDMHANASSFWSHVVLIIQVVVGYVMLAALITRLAVLTSSTAGPAEPADDPPGITSRSGSPPEHS